MEAIGYLLITTLKNRILSLKKKPILVILYLIIILSLVSSLIMATQIERKEEYGKSFADINILYGIILAVGFLFLYTFVSTGLSTGASLFSMADVGLLFVAPISSKKILLYGLIKQMGTTFFTAMFILYQVSTIKSNFGLGTGVIFNIFFIYGVILFYCQLLSISVYIFSNGNSLRKKLVSMVLHGLIILIAGIIYLYYQENGGSLFHTILGVMDLKSFQYIPVAGWAVMFIRGSIEGNMNLVLTSLLLFLSTGIGMILLFASGDADYYEDVLSNTEIMYNRLQDAKNGKTVYNRKKVKVKEQGTGLRRGLGSSTLFYKHLLEMKRTSRFLFIDTYTVIATIVAALLCYFIKTEISVYIVLGSFIYIQFFITVFGKLSMELAKPFIYLIPEKSVKKVFAASLTSLLKPGIDAVIIFTAVCIVSKTSPLLNLFLALAYASSGAIFVSFTLLCQRILGGQPNKLISAMLGMALFFIVFTPGIGASIAAIMLLPKAFIFLGTFPFTFTCMVITIFVFVVCGDLLDKSEVIVNQQ